MNNPRTFTCARCGIEEEALPTGITDIRGGTQFVYTIPQGWWTISTADGCVMFCQDEVVTIEAGEIIEDIPCQNGQTPPKTPTDNL